MEAFFLLTTFHRFSQGKSDTPVLKKKNKKQAYGGRGGCFNKLPRCPLSGVKVTWPSQLTLTITKAYVPNQKFITLHDTICGLCLVFYRLLCFWQGSFLKESSKNWKAKHPHTRKCFLNFATGSDMSCNFNSNFPVRVLLKISWASSVQTTAHLDNALV